MVQIPRLLLFLEFSRFSRINVSSFVVSPQDHFQRIFFLIIFTSFVRGQLLGSPHTVMPEVKLIVHIDNPAFITGPASLFPLPFL